MTKNIPTVIRLFDSHCDSKVPMTDTGVLAPYVKMFVFALLSFGGLRNELYVDSSRMLTEAPVSITKVTTLL